MKYFRTEDDTVLPGSVFSKARFAGMHTGDHTAVILTGPDQMFAEFNLGNISSSRIQFVDTTYQPGGVTHRHTHPEKQFYYVVSGQAAVSVDDQDSVIGPGGWVSIAGDVPHGFENAGDTPLHLLDVHSYELDGVRNQLGIAAVTHGPGEGEEEHRHDDGEEVYYVVSGQAAVTVGDEQATLEARGLAFIPRGTVHGYRNSGSEALQILIVSSSDV